ncbi:hypothetical protein NE237_014945 [Protea cynaroides]|uniref:Uncharacterized protein n=1 Tax=Protea cynaroides TaxID=273540 RepID=A0A9Q0KD78_9MAGN|nr:hypothetical protein NE237_014945 [Protea cynaroides]
MEQYRNHTTELSRDKISPPPSSSSPERVKSLIKADVREVIRREGLDESGIQGLTGNSYPSERVMASATLMQLISCGSIADKDCGMMSPRKDGGRGLSLISHYRYTGRLAAMILKATMSLGDVRFPYAR